MALMLQRPESLDDLALNLHTANVQRDRMPRRRLSSTDIVAQTLPRLKCRISAIYGEHDALYRSRLPEVHLAIQAWAQKWGQWHTVPRAGHWVQFEDVILFNEALLLALNSHQV
jgi:pimeloyl-ACP methyl ester carboxylesterase